MSEIVQIRNTSALKYRDHGVGVDSLSDVRNRYTKGPDITIFAVDARWHTESGRV